MNPALVSQPLETLTEWLSEAITAKHKILALKTPYTINHAGQSRSYNHQIIPELNEYINELQGAINAKQNTRAPRGPIYTGMGF